MAIQYLLDASAVLALLNDEPGSQQVWDAMDEAAISTVNLSEVQHKLCQQGLTPAESRSATQRLLLPSVPLSVEIVDAMSDLSPLSRDYNLSLGDRACLATAKRLGLTILGSDGRWSALPYEAKFVNIRT
jgi:ribonuclease VapC